MMEAPYHVDNIRPNLKQCHDVTLILEHLTDLLLNASRSRRLGHRQMKERPRSRPTPPGAKACVIVSILKTVLERFPRMAGKLPEGQAARPQACH
jgi:hypothetical protein